MDLPSSDVSQVLFKLSCDWLCSHTGSMHPQMFFTRHGFTVCFISFFPGVSKAVLKTMSIMDLDKVNLELIEALLEWIVAGRHSYPPGNFIVLGR